MSGKGKAKKILDKGIKNIGDLTNANNFLEKQRSVTDKVVALALPLTIWVWPTQWLSVTVIK